MRRRLLLLLVAWGVLGGSAPAQVRPERIVSLNLATDQYALLLVERPRLVGVSWLAHDPALSRLAEQAAGIPAVRGAAEEVVKLNPDLILTTAYTTPATTAMLRRLGRRVELVPLAQDLAGGAEALRVVARLVGAEARAEELIAETERRRQALATRRPARAEAVLAVTTYGWVSGSGSLADELVALAGHRNRAAEMGVAGHRQWSLEQTLLAGAEVLIVPEAAGATPGLVYEPFRHRAWAQLSRPPRRWSWPGAATMVAGPFTLEAAEQLAGAAEPR